MFLVSMLVALGSDKRTGQPCIAVIIPQYVQIRGCEAGHILLSTSPLLLTYDKLVKLPSSETAATTSASLSPQYME
jgi:hypothetical protein